MALGFIKQTAVWVALMGALMSFSVATAGAAAPIVYPGDFDLSRESYVQEVRAVLESHPQSEVILWLMESSEEYPAYKVARYPRFFSRENRVAWLSETFRQEPRVRVSDKSGEAEGSIFEALDQALKRVGGESPRILVRSETLEFWSELPGFEGFLQKNSLLVMEDSSQPDRSATIRERFGKLPQVQFLPIARVGGSPGVNSEKSSLKAYRADLMEFYSEFVRSELFKALPVTDELHAFLEKSASTHAGVEAWVMTDPQDGQAYEKLVRGLLSKMNPAERASIGRSLYGSLWLAWNSPGLESHRTLLALARRSIAGADRVMGSQFSERIGGFLRSCGERLRLTRLFYSRSKKGPISKKIGIFSGIQSDELESVRHFEMESRRRSGDVIVYRGIDVSPELNRIIEQVADHGLVSKVVLEALAEPGSTMESALARSRSVLAERGLQSALIEHLLGNFQDRSTFVATTFDPDVAARYAGPKGRVFRIRVPASEVIFASDEALWSRTPYQKSGNPYGQLGEVLVRHHIPADWIEEVYEVGEPPKDPAVGRWVRSWLARLKVVPWKYDRIRRQQGVIRCISQFFDDAG